MLARVPKYQLGTAKIKQIKKVRTPSLGKISSPPLPIAKGGFGGVKFF